MEFPKLMIASTGEYTIALLDDVTICEGIKRLDFSTENKDGKMRSTLRILDLDIQDAKLFKGAEKFSDFLECISAMKEAVKKSTYAETGADGK